MAHFTPKAILALLNWTLNKQSSGFLHVKVFVQRLKTKIKLFLFIFY